MERVYKLSIYLYRCSRSRYSLTAKRIQMRTLSYSTRAVRRLLYPSWRYMSCRSSGIVSASALSSEPRQVYTREKVPSMGDRLDLMSTCSRSALATGLPAFHVVGGALALSAGLNSGVGGSEMSADEEDRDEVGSSGYGSSSKFCTWMGIGAAGAAMR